VKGEGEHWDELVLIDEAGNKKDEYGKVSCIFCLSPK
jgi:hypothetical protein